jgi:hypothetical protein
MRQRSDNQYPLHSDIWFFHHIGFPHLRFEFSALRRINAVSTL